MPERIIVCLEADPQCARREPTELDAIADRVRAELAKPVAVVVLPVGYRAVVHRYEVAETAEPTVTVVVPAKPADRLSDAEPPREEHHRKRAKIGTPSRM